MEYEKGIEELDKCILLEPQFIKAYVRKGHSYMALDLWHRADISFSEGLKIAPNNGKLLKGATLVKNTVFDEVRKDSIMRDKSEKSKYDPEL